MSVKLVIVGAAGRMGQRLITLASEIEGLQLIGAVDRADHPQMGQDAGAVARIDPQGVNLTSDFPQDADVLIDFSLPEGASRTIDYCKSNKVALVMGTTGLNEAQKAEVTAASQTIPVIYGTNMGVGMNVLFAVVGKVAAMLGEDYDIEIIEQHHRFKKDAPSGSALSLAESICEEIGRSLDESLVHGREGKDALRQPGTIGMHAVRAGDIVGKHQVIYSTLGETVTISHTAHSRDVFVRGALRGAQWLAGKPAGMYSMRQVLGL